MTEFHFCPNLSFLWSAANLTTDATGREEKENDITRKNNAGEKNCGF